MTYPEKPTEAEKEAYYQFFKSLYIVLPCENCREHYKKYWDEHDIRPFLENDKQQFHEWVWLLHNSVNTRLQKRPWTLPEFLAKYQVADNDDDVEAVELSLMAVPPPVLKRPLMAAPRVRTRVVPKPYKKTEPPPQKKKKKDCKNCGRKW